MTDKELKMWQEDIEMISMLREKNEKLEQKIEKIMEIIELNKYNCGYQIQDQIFKEIKEEIINQSKLIGNK